MLRPACLAAMGLLLGSCGGGAPAPAPPVAACDLATVTGAAAPSGMCLSDAAASRLRDELRHRMEAGTLMEPAGGYDPRFYPAEVLMTMAGAAQALGDDVLGAWVDREIERLAEKLAATEGFLIWPVQVDGQPTFGSNSQSRLVLGLALLHATRPSPASLDATRLAFAALDRLPTLEVRSSVTGSMHRLPAYAYQNVASPHAISSRTLDPNQDAALALAYALYARHLARDDQDAASARARGNDYLDAALDLTSRPGCLMLADDPAFRDACDTRYNGFWLVLAQAAAAQLGRAAQVRPALEAQYGVMRHGWIDGRTSRNYPARYDGPYPDPVEPLLLYRPVAAFDATSWPAYVAMLERVIAGTAPASWPAGWLFPLALNRL